MSLGLSDSARLCISGVLVVQNALPLTISTFHDQLLNELPDVLSTLWRFELKTFRNNPLARSDPAVAPPAAFLYTLLLLYIPGRVVSITNTSSLLIVTASDTVGSDHPVPELHIRAGAATGMATPWDTVLTSKLQSLWMLRQTVRGENGKIYRLTIPKATLAATESAPAETVSGTLVVKTANCFLHGTFKGFLVELSWEFAETTAAGSVQHRQEVLVRLAQHLQLMQGRLVVDRLNEGTETLDPYGDLCLQYSRALAT